MNNNNREMVNKYLIVNVISFGRLFQSIINRFLKVMQVQLIFILTQLFTKLKITILRPTIITIATNALMIQAFILSFLIIFKTT